MRLLSSYCLNLKIVLLNTDELVLAEDEVKMLKALKHRENEHSEVEHDLRGFAKDPILTDSRFEAVLICEVNEITVDPAMLDAFGVTQNQVLDGHSRYRSVFRRKTARSGSHGQDALYLLGFGQVLISHQQDLKLHLRLVDGVRASIVSNGAENFLDKEIINEVSEIHWKAGLDVHATVEPFLKSAQHSTSAHDTMKLVREKSR